MKWLNRVERKLGHIGIKGLMLYIIAFNVIVFFLSMIDRTFIFKLMLIPDMVMKGEVWRLVTYLFIPPSFSMFWILFVLYFYYMVGTSLEHEWGTFKFNLYYLIGMIGTTVAAFAAGGAGNPTYLNLSLVLAFAYIFPNYQILIFFIVPVKMKYLAWAYAAFLGYSFFVSPSSGKIVIAASLINFIIFFGKDMFVRIKTGNKSYYRRRSYDAKVRLPSDHTIHKCEICGRTEKDDKNLEFRFCMDCEGDHEYCMEHLDTHQHIKKELE